MVNLIFVVAELKKFAIFKKLRSSESENANFRLKDQSFFGYKKKKNKKNGYDKDCITSQ